MTSDSPTPPTASSCSPVVDADAFAGHHPHVFVNALLGLFGALALMVAAVVLFQSQRAENALTGEDESAIRGMLELWGKNDSLGYFATRRDKSVVFAPNGRAAITYRVEVGVCLASGDPLGDPRAWPAAIGAWLTLCQSYGWAPGVMGASATAAQAFREAGLNATRTRRRGDSLPRPVQAVRARHEARAPGRDPGPARRSDGAHPSPPRPVPRGDEARHRPGRRLARHRDRARVLDGARASRRSGGRRLHARRGGRPERHRGRDAVVGAVGHQRCRRST